jgi:hypothetical protein
MVVINGEKIAAAGAGTVEAAVFTDQRDNSKDAGPMAVSAVWYNRMLTYEMYNDIPTKVQLLSWAITDADATSNFFKVAGDQTALFPAGHRFCVRQSTGNDTADTPYFVTSSSYIGGELKTQINVTNVADDTDDGTIWNGMFKFLEAGTYSMLGWATAGSINGADIRLVKIDGYSYTQGWVSAEGGTKTPALSGGFSWISDNTSRLLHFDTRITVSLNDVWEIQQWVESGRVETFGQGTGHLSGQPGTTDVINHAYLKISKAP